MHVTGRAVLYQNQEQKLHLCVPMCITGVQVFEPSSLLRRVNPSRKLDQKQCGGSRQCPWLAHCVPGVCRFLQGLYWEHVLMHTASETNLLPAVYSPHTHTPEKNFWTLRLWSFSSSFASSNCSCHVLLWLSIKAGTGMDNIGIKSFPFQRKCIHTRVLTRVNVELLLYVWMSLVVVALGLVGSCSASASSCDVHVWEHYADLGMG